MSEEGTPSTPRQRRQRRRGARRLRWHAGHPKWGVAPEERALTPEERAWRDAHQLAERKVDLTGDALKFGVLVTLLLIFLWPLGLIVLICGGPGLARKFYRIVVAPALRERFVEQEVERQVHATLHDERRLMEGEHARSMEELSASIAHEIRNPITAAKSLVQQMGEDPAARENVEYANIALAELRRVERSVSHLLRFARDEELKMTEMRMADVVESALETFRDRLARDGVALATQIDCDGAMTGDAEKLRRVVINLVGNAIDALVESRSAEPRVEVEMGENLAGSEVWLRVRDNGPGIDLEARRKIFDPFYSSKRGGTGLGLAITRKLVDAHGGEIDLQSQPEAGAEFLLTFPKQPPQRGVPA